MFKKILVANRGEIAVRVMATCREMGIRTVAIYSEADRMARHVREADEAYYIGPAPTSQSYLRIEAIIDAVRQSGAEAIHPGYGFLSENAAFVEACEVAGIVFIGPPAPAMRLMGSKIAAKQLAQSVGAPTVPGYIGESQDDAVLLEEARRVGFPLLIKASAGGGGKGMRAVYSIDEFAEQLAGARREAQASFGDATVFLERLLVQPRHIEIQILGDGHGNLIHLGERECSIQRRHQKIIEESPSAALTPALRAEMGTTAVRIARAAGYVNAGTVEFMLDRDGQYYFLEVNTRLQVEHPTTEFVTGLDLVRHQILIAAGEPLGLQQSEIIPRGHAIEVRLYAEDPAQDFIPSTGTINLFVPSQGPGIRVDSGIESGDEISQFYDPMIAKLIVYGEDRPASIARLQNALAQLAVFGVTTNASFLRAIAAHPAFFAGHTYTDFLEIHGLLGSSGEQETEQGAGDLSQYALLAAALYDVAAGAENANVGNGRLFQPGVAMASIAATGGRERNLSQPGVAMASIAATGGRERSPWLTLGPWRMAGEARSVSYEYQEKRYQVALSPVLDAPNSWHVRIDAQPLETVTCLFGNEHLVLIRQSHKQVRARVEHIDGATQVIIEGQVFRLERRQPPDVDISAQGGSVAHGQKTLTAPMAGTIVKVQVHNGQEVEQRQVLVILSAMKMEHTVTAPYTGKVRRVHYKEGDVVKGGATLVEME